MNFILLGGRYFALEPDKAAPRAEPVAQIGMIEVRHDSREQFRRFVGIDNAARLGEQRRRPWRRSQALRRGGRECRDARVATASPVALRAARQWPFRRQRVEHEPAADDEVDDGESARISEPQPGACAFLGAVDIDAAIKHCLHDAAMKGLRRGARTRRRPVRTFGIQQAGDRRRSLLLTRWLPLPDGRTSEDWLTLLVCCRSTALRYRCVLDNARNRIAQSPGGTTWTSGVRGNLSNVSVLHVASSGLSLQGAAWRGPECAPDCRAATIPHAGWRSGIALVLDLGADNRDAPSWPCTVASNLIL